MTWLGNPIAARWRVVLTAVTAPVVALALGSTALAAPAYAPVNEPGPPLAAPVADMQAALTCSPLVGHSDKEPVLLVPGTGATFKVQFSWNFAIALTKLGIPWCGLTPPQYQLGDIQTAAEYDVYGIRYLYHQSGDRKIAVVGHSQGGMQPRWALRFWPDTRAMVADDIGIAPDNQGVDDDGAGPAVRNGCEAAGYCQENVFQQYTGSNFIKALNSEQEMFPGIDYSVIYSETDELVFPADTPLDGPAYPGRYARISLQQVCPGHVADHLLDGTIDPVSWALTLDAITHPGPANAERIPHSVCSQVINPELDPAAVAIAYPQALAGLAYDNAEGPLTHGEPPLRCYVFADCPATARLRVAVTPTKGTLHHKTKYRILVTVDIQGTVSPVPDADVWIGNGRHLHTHQTGHAIVTLTWGRAGQRKVIATARQYKTGTSLIKVRRLRAA